MSTAWVDEGGTVRMRGTLDPSPGTSLPIQTGAGTPVGTVTPTAQGYAYLDTTNGALYLATGPTDTDWLAFGASVFDEAQPGVTFAPGSGGGIQVLAGAADVEFDGAAQFGDTYSSWNGNGLGLRWTGNGTEGEQDLTVVTGSTGQHHGTLQDKDGNQTVPGTITVGTDPTAALEVATKGYVDNGVKNTTIDIPTADVLTLSSVPLEVVGAPGVGKYIRVVDATWQLKPGATPFTYAGAGLNLYLSGGTWNQRAVTGALWIEGAIPLVGQFDATGSAHDTRAHAENAALLLAAEGGDPVSGNGSIGVSVTYRVTELV